MIYMPLPMINLAEIIQVRGKARFFPRTKSEWFEVLDIDGANAPGLYIFSLKAGRGFTPWYVGKAAQQSLRDEITTSDKILKFNGVVRDNIGTPFLTLIPRRTKEKESLSKIGRHTDIDDVETLLIQKCLLKNPSLLNIKKTSIYKNIVIGGMLNSRQGKPSSAICDFKSVIG